MDWFGRNPADLQGKPFHSLGVEQGQLEQLVSLAAESSEAYLNAGNVAARSVHILHKFSSPVSPRPFGKLAGSWKALEPLLLVVADSRARTLSRPLLTLPPAPRTLQVECDVVLQLGGTETQRVLIYNITRRVSNDLMIACDSRGKVVYCTTDIASMLK